MASGAAINATETGDLTLLINDLGKAFTIDGLGNKMRDWCDAAGLPQCIAWLAKSSGSNHGREGRHGS